MTVVADNDNDVAFTRGVADSAIIREYKVDMQDELNEVRDENDEASYGGVVAL
ncbi:MAG: hypothetical protein GY772_05250 [bacterium]|nr:hypothetical protein [bacterium]